MPLKMGRLVQLSNICLTQNFHSKISIIGTQGQNSHSPLFPKTMTKIYHISYCCQFIKYYLISLCHAQRDMHTVRFSILSSFLGYFTYSSSYIMNLKLNNCSKLHIQESTNTLIFKVMTIRLYARVGSSFIKYIMISSKSK